eukprot:SAG11_NODE_2676_length_3106_cov_1.906551_2_plen_188_part_00
MHAWPHSGDISALGWAQVLERAMTAMAEAEAAGEEPWWRAQRRRHQAKQLQLDLNEAARRLGFRRRLQQQLRTAAREPGGTDPSTDGRDASSEWVVLFGNLALRRALHALPPPGFNRERLAAAAVQGFVLSTQQPSREDAAPTVEHVRYDASASAGTVANNEFFHWQMETLRREVRSITKLRHPTQN